MSRETILVVEDESIVAEDIRLCLTALGYKVIGPVDSGEKAIELCSRQTPDLVLLDILLAGQLDGVETAEVLSRSYDFPVVYLTANSDAETLQRAKITLPFGFVLKPFSDRELESNIQMALHHQRISSQKNELIAALQEALGHVSKLQGMLPICSHCKSIRNDQGYWQAVEAYIAAHSDTKFSHGICPDCYDKYYRGPIAAAGGKA